MTEQRRPRSNALRALRRLAERLRANVRGNVLMIFGLALVPLTFATGMGIDYARAMRLQTKLNAAADAAALAAVSKPEMNKSASDAKDVAKQMFMAQTSSLIGQGGLVIDYNNLTQLTITVKDTTSANTTTRTATVAYSGQSKNAFAAVLGMTTLTIHGTSATTASNAPNIDFYIMMDTSPSMLLPATTAGLALMVAVTTPDNCAFACHQTGSSNDNYSKARANNIVLRTDLVTTAIQDLTSTATKVGQQNNVTYRMGLSDFDYMFRQIWPTAPRGGRYVDSDLATVQTHVPDAQIVTYCSNNYRVCGVNDNDTSTNFTTAMSGINGTMPDPGDGTNRPGDTPQEVVFLITDGMRDEANSFGRTMGPLPAAMCDAIKNRGIRIAVLYTQYLPESASDKWSVDNVKTPFLSPNDKISPAMQACASPGLYAQVTTDGDISTALAQLFLQVVATARLTQ